MAWRTWAWGSVRSRDDSQPWTRTTPGRRLASGGHVPGRDPHPVARSGSISNARRVGRVGSTPADAVGGSRRGRGTRARTGTQPRAAGPRARRGSPRGGRGGWVERATVTSARRRTVKRGRRALHSGRCPQRTPTSCSASSAAPPRRDQGRLAALARTAPPGPDRRRSRGRPPRDPPHGRDQRRVRGADARRRDDRGSAGEAGRSGQHAATRTGASTRARARRHGGRRRTGGRGAATAPRRPAAAAHTPGHRPPRPAATSTPRNQTTTPPGRRTPADRVSRRCAATAPQQELRASQPIRSDRARSAAPVHVPPAPPPARRGPRPSRWSSASSTATRWARSPRSSRRTSTGSPGPSAGTRSSWLAARVIARGPGPARDRRRDAAPRDARVAVATRTAAGRKHECAPGDTPGGTDEARMSAAVPRLRACWPMLRLFGS